MSELLKAQGTGFEILKVVIEEVHNHGGTDDDVRKILRDRFLVADIAKLIVGDIWKLYRMFVALTIDWESSLEDFAGSLKKVRSAKDVLTEEEDNAEKALKPLKDREYHLAHLQKTLNGSFIMEHYETAGFRELCMYLEKLSLPASAKIVALGCSNKGSKSRVERNLCTYATVEKDGIVLRRSDSRGMFGTDCFFLVREPGIAE